MKLIYIANARIPTDKANGRQIMKTCEALAAIGHDVVLWLPIKKQPSHLETTDPFKFYHVSEIFTLRHFFSLDRFRFTKNKSGITDYLAYLLQELSFVIAIIFWAYNHIGNRVVYSRCFTAAVVIKLLTRNKVFYESHNIGSNPLARRIFFLLLSLTDGSVVISEGLRREFSRSGISNIAVVPGSADVKEITQINRVTARHQLGFGSRLAVVYTGRLSKPKGVYTLIQVAKKMVQQEKSLYFYLVGDAPEESKQMLTELSRHYPKVKFIGPVSPRECHVYQRAADVLVLPGSAYFANPREYTSPLKLFEYLASGVPMVATDVPANTAILSHERNAYLVKPDDAASLARGIRTLLGNKRLAERISHQALKDSYLYTWKKRAQKIVDFVSK